MSRWVAGWHGAAFATVIQLGICAAACGQDSRPAGSAPLGVASQPAAIASQPVSDWLRVKGDRVNLRTRADINSLIAAVLERDSRLKGLGRVGDWFAVEPPAGVFCYVASEYVVRQPDGSGVVKVDTSLRVRAGSTEVDVDPTNSEALTMLSNGGAVRILGQQDHWIKIEPPPGVRYYVSAEFVEPASGPGSVGIGPSRERAGSQPAGADCASLVRALEHAIDDEARKDAGAQDWRSLLDEARELATHTEIGCADRAAAWVERLEQRVAEQGAQSQPAQAERVRVRGGPGQTRNFTASGILRPAFDVDSGQYGIRYRLEDSAGNITGYVEFPREAGLNVAAAVGHYVGVRGDRYYVREIGLSVITAMEMTVLDMSGNQPRGPVGPRRGG